jgi:hypothetical protein
VTAWSTDGVDRWVQVTIPDGGLMVVNCRPEGSVYTVAVGDQGYLVWDQVDEDPDFPSLGFVGPGDFDYNGLAALGDFSMFSSAYGMTSDHQWWNPLYDLDGNGAVGMGDFSIFRDLYGTSYTYAGGTPAAVTEPAAAILAAGALLAFAANNRAAIPPLRRGNDQ